MQGSSCSKIHGYYRTCRCRAGKPAEFPAGGPYSSSIRTMAYTDYFKNITQRRLILSVLAGGISALVLEAALIFLGITEHMPFILLGIFAILLIALLDWLDFCFVVFAKP